MTPHARTRRRRVVWGLTALTALWCLATLVPAAHPLFAHVCHQIPDRSFHVGGVPLPVCARCTGIYFGFLLGCVPFAASRLLSTRWTTPPRRSTLLLAALPVLLEGGMEISGLWAGVPLARCVTGAIFGMVVPLFFIPAADEMLVEARTELSRLIIKWENAHASTRAR